MFGQFTLTVRMGNAEMSEPEHLPELLRDVAEKIEAGRQSGRVFDVNGNGVGTFEFTEEP